MLSGTLWTYAKGHFSNAKSFPQFLLTYKESLTALQLPSLEIYIYIYMYITITQYRYFWNKTQTFGRIAGSFTAYRVSRFDHDSSAWVFVAIQQVWLCLFVRHKFQFFWKKHILGFHKQLGKLKFATFSFDKNQKGLALCHNFKFWSCVFPQNARVFKPPKSNPQEDGWDCCSKRFGKTPEWMIFCHMASWLATKDHEDAKVNGWTLFFTWWNLFGQQKHQGKIHCHKD